MDTQQYRFMYSHALPALPHPMSPAIPNTWGDNDQSSSSGSSSSEQSQIYPGCSVMDQVYNTFCSQYINDEQVESSIGPTRVMTRRQRAVQAGRRMPRSSRDSTEPNAQTEPQPSMFFQTSTTSRPPSPHDPANIGTMYPPPSDSLPLGTDSNAITLSMQSPTYPPTTASVASPYTSYPQYPTQSRSTPSSNSNSNSNPRSSPALSVASELTSLSSTSARTSHHLTPYPLPSLENISSIAPRQKQRKQRLFNVDRKAICLFHKLHPNARQEDIAIRYGVERSTISKILKHKNKWLNIPDHEDLRVAKHRPSKFPEIEEQMQKWLVEARNNGINITDASIRHRAKETARFLDIPEDKFKASSGWVENFKHRQGIRGGVWHGDGKPTRISRALDIGTFDVHAGTDPRFIPAFAPQFEPMIGCDEHDPQTGLRRGSHMDPSISLPSVWHRPLDDGTTLNVSLPSIPPSSCPHPPSMHDPTSQLIQHDSALHLDHIQTNLQHDPSMAYNPLGMYAAARPMPHGPPSQAGAEEAFGTVLAYVDTQGSDLLTPEDRRHLDRIKNALSRAGGGASFP